MNKSRTALILLSVIVFAALICPKSDAFTAGAGNIIDSRREFHNDGEVSCFIFFNVIILLRRVILWAWKCFSAKTPPDPLNHVKLMVDELIENLENAVVTVWLLVWCPEFSPLRA